MIASAMQAVGAAGVAVAAGLAWGLAPGMAVAGAALIVFGVAVER